MHIPYYAGKNLALHRGPRSPDRYQSRVMVKTPTYHLNYNYYKGWMDRCSSLLSVAEMKHSDQKQSREERVCMGCASRLESVTEKFRAGTQSSRTSRDLEETLLTGWLSASCSACFAMSPRPICLAMVLPTVGWTILQQLVNNPSHTRPLANMI